ncbi:MAG TPA: hypothetical protein VII39_02825 [Bradyrhizobium sp.]|jgi:hypothetical protein
MRLGALIAVGLLAASPALADPVCTKLAWPVDHELALMSAANADTASGTTIAGAPPLGLSLKLATGVALPAASLKSVDPAKFAGFVTLSAPAPGDYLVSLSGEAWVDVIQNGHSIVATDHSGDPNCPGLRKSVRFTLMGAPVTLEISNAPEDHIRIAVTPWFVGATPTR